MPAQPCCSPAGAVCTAEGEREGGWDGEGRRAPFRRGGRGEESRRDGTGGGGGVSGGGRVAAVLIMGVVLMCEVCSHLKPLI